MDEELYITKMTDPGANEYWIIGDKILAVNAGVKTGAIHKGGYRKIRKNTVISKIGQKATIF